MKGKHIEHYKDIPGFTKYEINKHGVIRNAKTHYVIAQRMNEYGYLYVELIDDNGKVCIRYVHRLVAIVFIPNPDSLPVVNHIDECSVHNSVDNLEWVTHKENANHGTRNERIVRKRKIPVLCFDEYGNTIKRYSCRYEAAEDLGVSEHSVRAAMKNGNRCRKMFFRAIIPGETMDDEYDNNIEYLRSFGK